MVNDTNKKLEIKLLNDLKNNNYCLHGLQERDSVKTEREKLLEEYNSLVKAEDVLKMNFPHSGDVLPSLQVEIELNKDGLLID